MIEEDKLALKNGTATIRCKIIVNQTDVLPEIILTEEDAIKNWEYTDERYVPQQGFIGQFVARTLEGNLQNISEDFDIENREIELIIGVVNVNKNTTNWYSLGNFIVTDPEDNEVKDNTKFQAMDYTKLFNKRFDGDYTDSVYTTSYNKQVETGGVTALWLAKYTCAQVGVVFPQTSFTNSDFTIQQNPFQAGESCRDVLKEISKLAYSWVRIGWDNKCYIDFAQNDDSTVTTYDVIDNNQYFTLETKKVPFGPINNVVIGMSGIDGESHSAKDNASIAQNGEHTIYIYDNPLTNTFELRALAQRKANKLFGLKYIQLSAETIGHPWWQGNERINFVNMEGGNNYTYPFNKTIKYSGHIRSTINSMGDSEVDATLAYESDVIKNLRQASINVDKQNGQITALVNTTNQIQKEINPTKDESGSEIIIEDASNNPLTYLEIEGKSTQETRSGKNRFNINGANKYVPSGTSYTIDGNSVNITGTWYVGFLIDVEANTDCTLSFEKVINVSATNAGLWNIYDTSISTRIHAGGSATKGTFNTGNNTQIYVLLYCGAGADNQGDVTFSNIQLEEGTVATPFEEFGVTPSPEFPSEIECVGYENLFDRETLSNYSNYTEKLNNNYVGYKKQLKPNTTYTIKVFADDWVGSGSWVYRIYNSSNTSLGILQNAGLDDDVVIKFTTDSTGIIYFANLYCNQERLTNWFNSVDILLVEGTQPYSYIPYGKYGIEIKTESKNKLDYKTCSPIQGGIVEIGEDKIKFTTNASCYGVQFPEIVLKPKTNYSMFCDYSFTGTMTQWGIRVGINGKWGTVTNNNLLVFATDETGKVIPAFYIGLPYTKEDDILELSNIRIYEGQYSKDTIPDYEPYQKNASLIVLNQPLRSLPNGAKDIAYIKNNKLYVDRYVGSIVLNGSETWGSVGNRYYTALELKRANTIRKPTALMSNYFKSMNNTDGTAFLGYINESYYSNGNKNVFINHDDGQGGLENFKNWLLTHNTEVTYELAEPYTEELGEIEMIKTLKGYNNITTTDDLLPIINLTYVRDTILADYVENHVTELKLTESEIKASVESVSSSVDGLNTSINRVEEITTDNSKVINIISTNIDKTSGEVREVTTATGFTFNADGMTINDGSGFKAEHKANGTYYKDGNSIVGEYTKDGSKQKDLSLFGIYSYGMKDKDDTPMFVGQLFTNENGEEGFGHFYNGGDY